MKIIKITTDNTMKELDINTSIEAYLESEIDDIQLLYYWNYENKTIKCYGLYIDNFSNINSHSLPPNGISPILEDNSDNIILSNNIYICAFNNNNTLTDMYISDYGNFYYIMNEQIEFNNDDIQEYNEEIIEAKINPSKKINSKNIIHNNINNLEYDNNKY